MDDPGPALHPGLDHDRRRPPRHRLGLLPHLGPDDDIRRAGLILDRQKDDPVGRRRPLPLRPVKGQILRLRGERQLRHVIRTPDIYLVPRADGELVVGATMEELGFDARSTAGAVHHLLREAWRAVPGVAELELAECGVGFRPALRDHLPAIGNVDGAGLFVATGHFRDGVVLAPITARLLADLICDDRPDALLEPFAPARFAAIEAAR